MILNFNRSHDGIACDNTWTIKRYRTVCKAQNNGLWINNVYDYNTMMNYVSSKQINKIDFPILNINLSINDTEKDIPTDVDEFLWSEISRILEDSRQFIEKSCRQYGINELESLLLSLKFCWSVIKKFRNMLWRGLHADTNMNDYVNSPLREALTYLITRFEMMMPSEDYIFSKNAVDEKLSSFRKEAAFETASMLEEETGAILHAKLML